MERKTPPLQSNLRRWTLLIPVLSTVGILALVASISTGEEEHSSKERDLLLRNERLIGEKLELEKQLALRDEALLNEQRTSAQTDQRIHQLQNALAQAQQAAAANGGRSKEVDKLKRQLAMLQTSKENALASLEGRYHAERDLQEQLEQLRMERDALAARLEQQQLGSHLVNNAMVQAIRGKRQHPTVKARRAREIRMGFDLPKEIASDATFKITCPDGKTHAGEDLATTVVTSARQDEALAAIHPMTMDHTKDRTARVHLKFTPKERLAPGTYRIDIWAGDLYLKTVLLDLR